MSAPTPDEYTPTTGQVRRALNGWDDRLDFDRWLAQHDAEVGEKVARNLERIAQASEAHATTIDGLEAAVLRANAHCFTVAANIAREVTS